MANKSEYNDAEILFQLIQKEKAQLVAEKKIKKGNPLPPIGDEEKPFKIPSTWKWVRWGDLAESIQYGYNAPAQKSGRIKMVRISDIQDGKVQWETVPFCSIPEDDIPAYLLQKNDILFARTGGTVGKSFLVEDVPEEAIYAGYLIRTRYSGLLSAKYLKYFMDSDFYWAQLRSGTKATAQPNCNGKTLANMILPLPPLAEQERIVARVEALFAKLDEAEEKIRAALTAFDRRRAALLRAAFTGRLTAAWRTAHGRSLEEWKKSSLKNCLKPQQAQKPGGETFRYIDIDSIDNKRQIVREPKILPTTKAPSRANRKLHENDIVFSLVRPYLKNIAYIDASLADCIASTGFYVCTCNDNLFPRYLYHFLCSDIAIQYSMQFMKGDNSPSIRKDEFVSMTINLPPLDEQREIVRVLDEAFAREAQARAAAEAALIAVPKLRRAVLARAFRGELGTNDPAEPPALSAD